MVDKALSIHEVVRTLNNIHSSKQTHLAHYLESLGSDAKAVTLLEQLRHVNFK